MQEEKKIYSSLIKAQRGFKEIVKNKQAYGYEYAPLDTVWKAVKDSLHDNGLCAYSTLEEAEGNLFLLTHLAHEGGEVITSRVLIPQGMQSKKLNSLQALGSALTYLRRYSLCALLGVQSEDDMDGQLPENLARELKIKSSDPGYTAKTRELLKQYSVERISQLPKKAESAAKKVLNNG